MRKKSSTTLSSPILPNEIRPKFSTFVDESDGDSVQIIEGDDSWFDSVSLYSLNNFLKNFDWILTNFFT